MPKDWHVEIRRFMENIVSKMMSGDANARQRRVLAVHRYYPAVYEKRDGEEIILYPKSSNPNELVPSNIAEKVNETLAGVLLEGAKPTRRNEAEASRTLSDILYWNFWVVKGSEIGRDVTDFEIALIEDSIALLWLLGRGNSVASIESLRAEYTESNETDSVIDASDG